MLDRVIKDAATAAFRNNSLRDQLSLEDRKRAAEFYEEIAAQALGTRADLARLYNLESVRFLRGEIDRIASTSLEFARETGYSESETDNE